MEKSAVVTGLAIASVLSVSSFAMAAPSEKIVSAVDQVRAELNVMFSNKELFNTRVHLPLQIIADNDFSSGPPKSNP
jgi:hypothetical protein